MNEQASNGTGNKYSSIATSSSWLLQYSSSTLNNAGGGGGGGLQPQPHRSLGTSTPPTSMFAHPSTPQALTPTPGNVATLLDPSNNNNNNNNKFTFMSNKMSTSSSTSSTASISAFTFNNHHHHQQHNHHHNQQHHQQQHQQQQQQFSGSGSMATTPINPFEETNKFRLEQSVLSPNLFHVANTSTPERDTKSLWNIDQRAVLYPADIPTDEPSLMAQYLYDHKLNKQMSAAVEAFWSQNKVIIESPLASSTGSALRSHFAATVHAANGGGGGGASPACTMNANGGSSTKKNAHNPGASGSCGSHTKMRCDVGGSGCSLSVNSPLSVDMKKTYVTRLATTAAQCHSGGSTSSTASSSKHHHHHHHHHNHNQYNQQQQQQHPNHNHVQAQSARVGSDCGTRNQSEPISKSTSAIFRIFSDFSKCYSRRLSDNVELSEQLRSRPAGGSPSLPAQRPANSRRRHSEPVQHVHSQEALRPQLGRAVLVYRSPPPPPPPPPLPAASICHKQQQQKQQRPL